MAYLSKLDSRDVQVYNAISNNGVYSAILTYDLSLINSEMLNLRFWIIYSFIIMLLALVICIYSAFALLCNIMIFKNTSKKSYDYDKNSDETERKEIENQLHLLEELGFYNRTVIDNFDIEIKQIDKIDKKCLFDNITYCNKGMLNKFVDDMQIKIRKAVRKNEMRVIAKDISKEVKKIAKWNSILRKYI